MPLVFTAEGLHLSRLSRHVELFYLAVAPLYAVIPTPATLLVLQAGLYALGAVPMYCLAKRKLGSAQAEALSTLSGPGALSADAAAVIIFSSPP
jgi:uncharacterized membrane protein